MPYPPQGGGGGSLRYQITPSDNVLASADTERSTTGTDYVKMKEMKVNAFGKVRTYFELKYTSTGASGSVYACVGRNGYLVGTERSLWSATAYPDTYYAFTEDIDNWMEGDSYQLYAKVSAAGLTAYVRNFRLCGDIKIIISPPVARVDLD